MNTDIKEKQFINGNLQIVLGALLWSFAIYMVIYKSAFLPGNDVYYHIELSEIMKNHGLVFKSFPWTTHSVWNNSFFDKEWLFHVFLIPFLFLGKVMGAKAALLSLTFMIGLAWGSLFKALKCKYIFFIMLLTIFCGGTSFLGRLMLLRAHLLSIFLIALCLTCIIKKWRLGLIITSILYCLSYTGSWQIIPIAFMFDIVEIAYKKRIGNILRLTFIWALLGIVIGTLINPYFPTNVSGGILQNIIVLKSSWLGTNGAKIMLGDELYPIAFRQLMTIYMPVIIILLITLYHCINSKKKLKNGYITISFGLLSLIYLILTVLTVKFTDYFVPVSIAFAASAWHYKLHFWGKKSFLTYIVAILLVLFGYYSIGKLHTATCRSTLLYSGATKWLNENIQDQKTFSKTGIPGKIVFTGGWDDTPALFYGAPQFKYLVFLDPNFMYAYSHEKYILWRRIADGKVTYPAIRIYKNFNSNIVFVSKYKKRLCYVLAGSPYAKLVYRGPDGESLFIINIPESELKKFKKMGQKTKQQR